MTVLYMYDEVILSQMKLYCFLKLILYMSILDVSRGKGPSFGEKISQPPLPSTLLTIFNPPVIMYHTEL